MKRQTKEQKHEAEVAALAGELGLLALGAGGTIDAYDADLDLMCTLGANGFERFLQAIATRWEIAAAPRDAITDSQRWPRCPVLHYWNLGHYENLAMAAEFMHRNGARAGGKWVPLPSAG